MPVVQIDKKTRWECQLCGQCCRDIILSKNKSLSVEIDGKPVCKFLDLKNMCTDYENRPYICRIYPFVADFDKLVDNEGVARPSEVFSIENLQIHTECPGYGQGKRIYGNKRLHKKLDQLKDEFALRLKDAVEKGKGVDSVLW